MGFMKQLSIERGNGRIEDAAETFGRGYERQAEMIEIRRDESRGAWRIRMNRSARLQLITGLERHADTRHIGAMLREKTGGEVFAGSLTTETIRAQAELSGIRLSPDTLAAN